MVLNQVLNQVLNHIKLTNITLSGILNFLLNTVKTAGIYSLNWKFFGKLDLKVKSYKNISSIYTLKKYTFCEEMKK